MQQLSRPNSGASGRSALPADTSRNTLPPLVSSTVGAAAAASAPAERAAQALQRNFSVAPLERLPTPPSVLGLPADDVDGAPAPGAPGELALLGIGRVSDDQEQFKRSLGLDPLVRLYVIRGNPHGADMSQVRRAIEMAGFVENTWDPDGPHFELQWGNRDRVDFQALSPRQRVSNFERCRDLTTKSGLAVSLEDASFWADVNPDTFSARTFVCNSAGAIDQFVLEFKASKALCVLKAWFSHMTAGGLAQDTFPEPVARTALAVLKRRWMDIDAFLSGDENEAEQVDFEVREEEWEILAEADFDNPSAPSMALERQQRQRMERKRSKLLSLQLVQRRIAELEKQGAKRRELEERRERERERKQEQRRLLRERALRHSASAAGVACLVAEADESPCRMHSASMPTLRSVRSPSVAAGVSARTERAADLAATTRARSLSLRLAPGDEMEDEDGENVELVEGPSGVALAAAARELLGQLRREPQYGVSNRNIWIMKPVGRLRGQGIFLEDDLEKICKHVRHTKDAGMRNSYVCQRYIENALLVGGSRKHDIRQWVAITSINPLTVWFFSESYVRLAANEYSLTDIHDQFAHLNNNAINCLHENYDPDDEYWRCQWDLATYRRHLEAKFGYDAYAEKILPAMKRIVMTSIACVRSSFGEPESSDSSFQLLGYDFFVADDLSVWLLEVNSDPLMHASCEVTERLCEPCLQDLMRVATTGVSGGGPGPHFELLHRAERLPPVRLEAHRHVLAVEGTHLTRPQAACPMAQGPSAEEIRSAQERLKAQRDREIQEAVDRRKHGKEKEMQKRERQARLQKMLRARMLAPPAD